MAGYSGTSLQKKLGTKPGIRMLIVNAPANYFELISPLPTDVTVTKKSAPETPFIHFFATELKLLKAQFRKLMKCLTKDGMLWISWPKKSSKVTTDLDENVIRALGLKEGLVDVKVCAGDETWSALKFVFRLKDR